MAAKGPGAYLAIGLPPTLRDEAAKDGAPTVWGCLWKVKINRKGESGGQECPPCTIDIPALRFAIGRGTRHYFSIRQSRKSLTC